MFFTDTDFYNSLRLARAFLSAGVVVLFSLAFWKSRRFGKTPGMDYLRLMLWGMDVAEIFLTGFQLAAYIYGPASAARGLWQILYTIGEIIRFVSLAPFGLFLLGVLRSRYRTRPNAFRSHRTPRRERDDLTPDSFEQGGR